MTRVDIFSGFLGAGKTTLIKKLIKEAYAGQKLVLIENEFGEIGIDGGFLKDAGIEITEMNSGCICCSLSGDFKKALKKVVEEYHPDRIIIEPTGVGALSTVVDAVIDTDADLKVGGLTTIVDAGKCKKYIRNFGEFFNDQVETATVIILSRTQMVDSSVTEDAVEILETKNPNATIVTANWDELDGKEILSLIEGKDLLKEQIEEMLHEHEEECDDPDCSCHHHHDDDDDDDDDCDHDHEEHEHHHHHHHHADEVFTSFGRETAKRFSKEDIEKILSAIESEEEYGMVLRAKGILQSTEGSWIHFDYTPGEKDIRDGAAAPTGMLCVIGHDIKEDNIEKLFGLK